MPSGIEKCQAVAAVAHDFNNSAKRFGTIIMEEYFWPQHKKTVKPHLLGGVAGGEKFVHDGIIFKIALGDKEHDPHRLYNGSDEFAAKAAGHEFRGTASVFRVQKSAGYPSELEQVNVPLVCLLDCRGMRCLASCMLPLKKLQYGSKDAMKTAHADNPSLNASIAEIAARLGLAQHTLYGFYVVPASIA
jgi:hypothetical protein